MSAILICLTGWNLCEQVYIAALDCGLRDISSQCLDRLTAQFPGSSRVKLLIAMDAEADGNNTDYMQSYITTEFFMLINHNLNIQGDYEFSLKVCDEVLSANPANLLAIKRKVYQLHLFYNLFY